jgi:protein-tyrosine phosphatase
MADSPSFCNFRDLGGIRTGTGTVRRGLVFRSDSLASVSEDEVGDLVGGRGIRTAIDLRQDREVTTRPLEALAGAGVSVHHVPLLDPSRAASAPLDLLEASLEELYAFVIETSGAEFVQALRVVADPAARPVVFMCAGGKDRTGLLAAMLLSLLGADDDTVAQDYAKTAEVLHLIIARSAPADLSTWNVTDAQRQRFTTAEPATILGALAVIREHDGSVAGYVRRHGLDDDTVEQLRDDLVERAP